jgi:short-subunit dehydrogenase
MHESVLVTGRKLPTSEKVGRAGYSAMMAGTRVYVSELFNKILAQSVRFSPRNMVTWVAKKITGPASQES